MTPNENWSEYRRMILQFCEETKEDLDDIHGDIETARETVSSLKEDIIVMKTRWALITGIIGFLAGLVPVLVQIYFGK